MNNRRSLFVLTVLTMLTVSIPLSAIAANNDAYKLCIDNAKADRIMGESETLEDYYFALQDAYRDYREDIRETKSITDRDARKDAMDQAKDALKNRLRDAKNERNAAKKSVQDEHRRAVQRCKDERADQPDNDDNQEVGECRSSSECSNGRICSTVRGECLPACKDKTQICIQVCTGHCIRP